MIRCANVCGLVLATPTGSSYGCLRLTKGPTMLKFEWLLCFMLKLAGQRRVYADIYIYIYIYTLTYIYILVIYTRLCSGYNDMPTGKGVAIV